MKSVLAFVMAVGSAVCLAAGASPVAASDSPVQDTHYLDEVTVSASKRDASAKEFPGIVTAFQEPALDQRGVRDLLDLTRYAPNVHLKHATSGDTMVIRGMSTIDTSLYSPAGLYIDDVAYPLGYMANAALFDVERVEVLRGPQGTLYGRNSESGVINLVLKKPDNEYRAKLMADFASYNAYRLGANLSGPLYTDKLYLGGYFLWSYSDGYMNNITKDDDQAAGKDDLQGRGVLRWTPNEHLDLSLTLDGSREDDGIGRLRYISGANASQPYTVRSNAADSSDSDSFSQSLRAEYKTDDLTLLSVTNHRYFGYGFLSDLDRGKTTLGSSDMDMSMWGWSQELRLSSRGKQRLNWLVGMYGDYQDLDVRMKRNHVMTAMRALRETTTNSSSVATFGQATYSLLSDLRFTAGLRLEASQSSGEQEFSTAKTNKNFQEDLEELTLLPMASLAYDLSKSVTVYATFSTGFLAGGYNFYSAGSQEAFAYDPEYTYNYEVGLKASTLQGRLLANLALFHTDIQDKQVREDTGGGVGLWKFSNAAEASSRGAELELQFMPLPGLEISGGVGYALSEIDEWKFSEDGIVTDYSGKQLPWSPEFTYNLGVGYQHSSGLFARADLYGAGRQYFNADNSLTQEPYQLVGLRLGYAMESMEIALWCRNLFDVEYYNKMVADSSGNTMVEDGEPRVVGVSLTGRF